MNLRAFLASAAVALLFTAGIRAENLPLDHPTAKVVNAYLEAVVKQDWKTASTMLLPVSLERRKTQMITSVKNSTTMTEEAAKLNMLGVKDVAELQKMTPQEAYVADRAAVHSRMKVSPETIKKKQETLKINILGLVSEESGKIVHAVVRTRQETTDVAIEELLLISLTQDKLDTKKWHVVPDMQQPITTPLAAAKAAP
ncbi:hypothetical protein [Verrucomicrobium sp. BvORR106]|uniref:hypothetical protein n=1 Tax=Verrucomicrobium sp. BvORR106 TaxID=1403819 RepID=UPI00056F71B2|nr:hypothetical protein [Verrucomicrobium sp. BvORR106]